MRAFVVALLLVPVAHAAWVEDAEGDLRAESQDQSAPVMGPAYASIDLTAFDVVEEKDAFTFTLHMADIGVPEEGAPDGTLCDLSFTHNARAFRIRLHRLLSALDAGYGALYVRDGEGAWESHSEADLTTTVDAAADTVTYRIARGDLADADGAAPFPGRSLEAVQVACSNGTGSSSFAPGLVDLQVPARVRDDLPDPGATALAWPIAIGARQSGHALLTSLQPFRASNGEETTIAYNVTAHNLGSSADDFVLVARDVPPSVDITLASDRLHLGAGETMPFTVWVSVPFAHQHGATTSFLLELASASDPGSVGRIELGVRYLSVPQPSGHHDTLYLHSFGEQGVTDTVAKTAPGVYGVDGYMNTLQDDPGDSGDGLPFSGGSDGVTEDKHDYSIGLSPSLLLGLDADLSRVGEAMFQFGSRVDMDLTVSAEVIVYGGGDLVTLATLEATKATPNAAGDRYTVTGPLAPQPEADLIPFAPGLQLSLEVHVVNTAPSALGVDSPWLLTGSWLRLPLLDYQDAASDLPAGEAIVLAGSPVAVEDPPAKESPVGPWAPLAALAVAFLMRRRR